jgi:hypothetical protein
MSLLARLEGKTGKTASMSYPAILRAVEKAICAISRQRLSRWLTQL